MTKENKKNIALTVKNLHISYKGLKKTSIKSFWKHLLDKVEVYEVLKGISFEVEEGKILGIVGVNGSGKSTLLRALAGIFSPDKGNIDLHGNSIALLSLGVGFNKNLSGYENIYLSGMLLGFSEEQIKQKEKAIIDFADIDDYIYREVKTYSSGMYSKLAFSITAILETDIILIDEVLSVGDAKFKEKSYNKMKELISNEKRTVIIVTHNLNTVKELCNQVIWLNNGKIIENGDPKQVITKYNEFIKK